MNDEELFYLLKEQIPDLVLTGDMRQAQTKIEKLEAMEVPYLQTLAVIMKAYLYFRIGKFKLAEELLNRIDPDGLLNEDTEINSILAAMWHDVQGMVRIKTNRTSEGKACFNKGIQILEERSITCLELGHLYNDLYHCHFFEGDLTAASAVLQKAERIYLQFGNQRRLGHVFANYSSIALARQQLDEALKFCNKAQGIFEQLNSFQDLAYVFRNLGRIALYENNFQAAASYHRKSLEIRRVLGNQREIAESLFYLIHAMIIFNRHENEEFKFYIESLAKIAEEEDIEFIRVLNNLAKGLELKKSANLNEKFESAEYFRMVVQSTYQNVEFTTIALTNLLELDLLELRAIPDNRDLIKEIMTYFDLLDELNRNREIKELQVSLAVVKSRLALLDHNFSLAYTILQNAKKEIGVDMDYLSNLLSKEMKKMNASLLSWQERVKENRAVFQRLNHEELLNYLRIAADVTKSM